MKALVTGGCRGLGKCFTEELLKRGYEVLALYNTSEHSALELSSIYPNLNCVQCDITDEDKVKKVLSDIASLDLIINNAAIAKDNSYLDKTYEEFMHVIGTNLGGTFNIIKHGSKKMDKGVIINISSNNTLGYNNILSMDYDASKAGVNMLTINFSEALPNIKVIAYAPGWINTEAIREMNPLYLEEELKRSEQSSLIDPTALVAYILDDYQNQKSGSIIHIKEV